MIRKIIHIDESLCNGCGACAVACHEGAIGMIDGKAKLLRDDYCDGMGDCLPECPTGALSFEEREAAAYDEAAVMENMKKRKAAEALGANGQSAPSPALHEHQGPQGGCPGSRIRQMNRRDDGQHSVSGDGGQGGSNTSVKLSSQLSNWPVQIKLAPLSAPYFEGAKLLIAADCTAYAYAAFHQDFIRGKVTLIGCPKLDAVDYTEKLTHIIANNDIKSVTIVRMEVPCCGGLEMAAKAALQNSGKFIPWQVVTVSIDGNILD